MEDQHHGDPAQYEGHQVPEDAQEVGQPVTDSAAEAAAVKPEVEDEAEVDREGTECQPDQVKASLVQPATGPTKAWKTGGFSRTGSLLGHRLTISRDPVPSLPKTAL